ncbi:MAG: MFS transporter [Chloroflexi bacterium]|nr:MFS transporter [Chloroflexota bacterium]MDA1228457.1 MFS transporter [Chloroflexota bacterium]
MANVIDLNLPSRLINKANFHYAWVIVATLALVQVVALSINFAGGVLVQPLSDSEGQFGFSLTSIGAAFGLYFVTAAVLAPVAGWLGDRYGARKMMILGAVWYCSVLVAVAYMNTSWQLLLTFGVLRGAVQSIFMVPLMAAVAGWFRRQLGLGTGILWAASGVGPFVMAPLLGNMVVGIGWHSTFLILATAAGIILITLTLFFRDRPEDLGIKPYGMGDDEPFQARLASNIEQMRAKVFNSHVRRTRAFWNLPAIHGLGCAGHGIVMVFTVPLAVQRGMALTDAAWILGIISLVSISSRLLTPILAERHGTKRVMATCLAIQGLAVIYLFFAQSPLEFYIFAAIFGVGFGGEWTGYLVINRQYYGTGPLGRVYGWQMSGALLGHAFVSMVAGVMLDLTGTYNSIIVLSIIASLAGAVVTILLEPTSHMIIGDWEESLPEEARPVLSSGVAD